MTTKRPRIKKTDSIFSVSVIALSIRCLSDLEHLLSDNRSDRYNDEHVIEYANGKQSDDDTSDTSMHM